MKRERAELKSWLEPLLCKFPRLEVEALDNLTLKAW